MSKNLIIVFTRNPELGKVKTRLAKTIGDESALKIYEYLLIHTEKIIRDINSDKAVYYSVKVRSNDIWDETIYQKHQQEGDDLGIRMLNAFKKGFDHNYNKIIIIGSDLYDLQTETIINAFDELNNHDVVIGPALDGGYYLLGMKTLNTKIFKNKIWGSSSVLKDTLKDVFNLNLRLLDKKNDIDTWEDIKDIPFFEKFIN